MQISYDPEVLQKLKDTELSMLKDIDAVCEKHGINWFALFGTMLGAVRHKGFIPWDDDIDIGMFRADYEKFKKVFDEELGEKYRLSAPDIEEGYSSSVIKVQKRGTRFVSPYGDENDKTGIFIDIFVYDHLAEGKAGGRQIRIARLLTMLLFLRYSGRPEIQQKGAYGMAMRAACRVIHAVLSVLHISPAFLYRLFTKNATSANGKKADLRCSFQCVRIRSTAVSRGEALPLIRVRFEDMLIPVFREYDTVLTRVYGDYMTLPPKEGQVNHAAKILDFGD